jgi:hypothetical protein
MDLVSSIFDNADLSAPPPRVPRPAPRSTSGSSFGSSSNRSVQDSFEAALEEEMAKLRNLSSEMKTRPATPAPSSSKSAMSGFDEIEENLRKMRELVKPDSPSDK